MADTTLTSMKISKAEREARYSEKSIATEGPMYPYGLSIQLDDESLEKLGIDVKDLAVGSTMVLVAKVEISSVSSNESTGGPARQSASLQITEMCLEGEGAKASDAAKALYA
jgi:hypothetical protein